MEELAPYLSEISWSPERHAQTDESHASLCNSALVAGDVEVARSETRTHLQVAYNMLLDQLREPTEMPSSLFSAGQVGNIRAISGGPDVVDPRLWIEDVISLC